MAVLAFRHGRSGGTVMACTAVLALIHVVHRHLPSGLSHPEYLRVAVVTGKDRGMEPMAEDDVADPLDFIGDILSEVLQVVAPGTFRRRKGLFAVMTRTTVSSLVYVVHRHPGRPPFHLEYPEMTLLAAQFRMESVVEFGRESRCGDGERRETVTVLADRFVDLHVLMAFEGMALVAVIAGVLVELMGEDAFRTRGKPGV